MLLQLVCEGIETSWWFSDEVKKTMNIYAFMTYSYYVYHVFEEMFSMCLEIPNKYLALVFILLTYYHLRLNFGKLWIVLGSCPKLAPKIWIWVTSLTLWTKIFRLQPYEWRLVHASRSFQPDAQLGIFATRV